MTARITDDRSWRYPKGTVERAPTLAYKKRFVREAIAGEYLIFFEHDPRVPVGLLRNDGRGRPVVEPYRQADA